MAKPKDNAEGQAVPARSASINLDETQGRAALAAWKMLYHIFGARVEEWKPTPNGVEAINFSTFATHDPETIIKDVSPRKRRLDFLTVSPWINGQAPEPYADAGEITADTVKFYKGAVEEGSAKSPPYVKTGVATYKSANALAKKRGPKARTIRLDRLDELEDNVLENMESEDIAILQAALERVARTKANSTPVEAAAV